MSRPEDPIELLFPGAPAAQAERARRALTFFRLVVADARKAEASNVRTSLTAARDEFELDARRRALGAVLALLRHHLYAALGPDSFLWFGEADGRTQTAWSELEAERGERPWLASTPEPGESPASVASRLIESAQRLELAPEEAGLWRARLARAEAGPEAGEKAFRELLAAVRARGERDRIGAAALAGVVECCLDRGAVRHARVALDEGRDLAAGDPRLRRLAVWVALVLDDEVGLRAWQHGLADWKGRLPAGLAELRQRRPAWLDSLTGKAAGGAKAPARAAHAPSGCASRRDLGAALLAVFALRDKDAHALVHLDVAPGLRPRAREWLSDRDGACTDRDEPEHRLVIAAAAIAMHRTSAAPLRGAIQPATVRALALAPVLDDAGDIAGWLRIECEHHLLPSTARLAAAAASWRERVLAQRTDAATGHVPAAAAASHATIRVDEGGLSPRHDSASAEAFRALVDDLAIKTAQRRWWGFCVDGTAIDLVAEGGGVIGERAAQPGGRRALSRALLTAGIVRFDEPAADLAMLAPSASGVVLPIVAPGRLCGLLAIESARRKDFAEAAAARLGERAQSFAVELRLAQFRDWHVQRFGHDLWLSARGPEGESRFGELFAAARSRAAVALTGPTGAGKATLARWLHFEGGRAHEPFVVFACGTDERELWEGDRGERSLVARAARGTLVLRDVERLSEASQVRVLEAIEPRAHAHTPAGARVLATSASTLAEAHARGALRRDLADALERLELRVPPLARRRGDIPALADSIARRLARAERSCAPSFDDSALACLWRQPWEGNLRALENLLFKVVLLHPGEVVGAEALERVAARFGVVLQRRIPSRQPEREDVLAALETTRKQRGTWNKTRAAAYLGWDPDTLVARMGECGLLEGAVECADTAHPAAASAPRPASASG